MKTYLNIPSNMFYVPSCSEGMITKRREISFKKTNLKRCTRDLYNKDHLSLIEIKVNVVMYFCRTRNVDRGDLFKASKNRRSDYSSFNLHIGS